VALCPRVCPSIRPCLRRRYASLIQSINALAAECYVGFRKYYMNMRGYENGVEEAFAGIRAWLAVAAPWWLQRRGISIVLQTEDWKTVGMSVFERPCHLFLAVISGHVPPPVAEGQTAEAPPVYPPQSAGGPHAHAAAPGPPAQTMETGTHTGTMVHVQGAQTVTVSG